MQPILSTALNVVLMIVGFGLVIVVHEFGHFAAARWAGVRVHTFAVGFGSAIATWRKGMGFRWGSSEKEYFRRAREEGEACAVSPTEYRLNWFPFGGYVKMLGQEDLSPIPTMTASDSFAAKPVWKRMVIMSGGVFMNLVLAGVLFVAAYLHGIQEVAPIIGDVGPGTPAEAAGLRAGDRVLSIDGGEATTFNDLRLAAAMGSPRTPIHLTVARDGEAGPVEIDVTPRVGAEGMLQIGVAPSASAWLVSEKDLKSDSLRDEYRRQLQEAGLGSVQPGMRLIRVNGAAIPEGTGEPTGAPTANMLRAAMEASGGEAVSAVFADESGREVEVSLLAQPELQSGQIKAGEATLGVRHLLGLAPVMRVSATQERGEKAGLLPGDVFARIGRVEWPSVASGIAEVRANRGKTLDVVVVRDGVHVPLKVSVSSDGLIGFLTGDTSAEDTRIGSVDGLMPTGSAGGVETFAAARLNPGLLPGSRVVAVNGAAVANFRELRAALVRATARGEAPDVMLTLALPMNDASGAPVREQVSLSLTGEDVAGLHALGWDATQTMLCFDLAKFLDRAKTPWDALTKGVEKTHYVVMMTYVTFLRLFQGTVPVDQLHGPVGITHIGSQVAEQGFVYLIFFLGLISANLAVINFLPLPIVDGGHMVFLAIEGLTKKPVSAAVQNVSIIAGLLIVGTVFVVVTYHDLVRLFG
ncbi:MAG: site-2 protease family protein [Phycisphaerae bacterium]|nr:site-2 protease family protein [Phycisphaerae bacterium]